MEEGLNMTTAFISAGGKIAIPKAVRERLNLKAGSQVSIDVQGEALVIRPLEGIDPDWRTMEGMARGGETLTQALVQDRSAEQVHDHGRLKGC
jgi:AbrB family looped-hinge helix DNA binding protein